MRNTVGRSELSALSAGPSHIAATASILDHGSSKTSFPKSARSSNASSRSPCIVRHSQPQPQQPTSPPCIPERTTKRTACLLLLLRQRYPHAAHIQFTLFPSAIPNLPQLAARYNVFPIASPSSPALSSLSSLIPPARCCRCRCRRHRRSHRLCIDGVSKPSQACPFLALKPPLSPMITDDHLAISIYLFCSRRRSAPPRPRTRIKPWS